MDSVLGMRGIDFLTSVQFLKRSWVQFGMSSVRFEKRGSVRILQLLATYVMVE